MAGPETLDESENERIFLEDILPALSPYYPPPRSVRRPKGIIMGGQMGSGKSRLSGLLADKTRPRPYVIDFDELRSFHPLYPELRFTDPTRAVAVSAPDAGKWTEKVIAALCQRKANALVEGTMRRFEPFQNTAQVFKRNGYTVQAAILAVNGLVSWQATILRAEMMAQAGQGMRTVLRSAHDEALQGVLDTAGRIADSGLADQISVHNRDGKPLLVATLIDGKFPRPDVVRKTIQAERDRDWSDDEKAEHDARWVTALAMMEARGAPEPDVERVREMRDLDAETLGYAIPASGAAYGK